MINALFQLQKASNDIAIKFDSIYIEDLEELSKEITISYNLLSGLLKREPHLKEYELQSVLMYWGALNSILSALDLLRRGYAREPHIIMRSAVELCATSYEICHNVKKYGEYKKNPDKFDSTKSIKVVKGVFPMFGQMYGELSNTFTHVSGMHMAPNDMRDGKIVIGGMLDTADLTIPTQSLGVLATTIDILNAIIELTFFSQIPSARFWKKLDGGYCEYMPKKDRMDIIMNRTRKV